MAGEGEGITEIWAKVLFHLVLKQAAAAMQPGFHCFGQDAKKLSRLVDTHSLDQARDQNYSESLWKVIDSTLQQGSDFTSSRGCFWIEVRG
jgi:hypothetical protein